MKNPAEQLALMCLTVGRVQLCAVFEVQSTVFPDILFDIVVITSIVFVFVCFQLAVIFYLTERSHQVHYLWLDCPVVTVQLVFIASQKDMYKI